MPRRARAGPTIWTDEEVARLRLEVARLPPLHLLTLDVLLATGLRTSEALALTHADLRPDGFIDVRYGKGGYARTAYFADGGPASPTKARVGTQAHEHDPAALALPLKQMTFYMGLRRAARRAGLQRVWRPGHHHDTHVFRPHAARHTWVARCRRAGISWETIALLGWGDASALPTVMRYYWTVDASDILRDATTRHFTATEA